MQHLQADDSKADYSDNDFFMIRHGVRTVEPGGPMFLRVKIFDVNVDMEVDTGTFVAVMCTKEKNELFPEVPIENTESLLKCVGEIKLPLVGVIRKVEVCYRSVRKYLELHIIEGSGPILIGRHWLAEFGLWPIDLQRTIGTYKHGEFKLRLKPNAQPVALKARRIPFAMRAKVETELERLLKLGHIEKVELSEWVTPIVLVPKGKGVRICSDFKLTVNPFLVVDKYPLPLIDEIFNSLQGGITFSQIDLSHAYMQIVVEEKSRELLTINTHKGLFRYRKMPEGVASGPGDFQRKMEECLSRVPNTAAPSKIKAILEVPSPTNAKQVSSFLGLANYYARFLPARAIKLKPLYSCCNKGEFKWSAECEEAFQWVKNEITSDRILAHYKPKVDLVLTCDATKYGLSAILSHKYKDGSKRAIHFASKVLPKREIGRAIIDKEAAAILFGFKKFYNYIYGHEIILRTDHKPLVFIFGPHKGFRYKIEYIKSVDNGSCDALSRMPIFDSTQVFDRDISTISYIDEGLHAVTSDGIRRETGKCPEVGKIIGYLREKWPSFNQLTAAEKKYHEIRLELSVEKDCILRGSRVVVPSSLREAVLKELYESHFGIVKMKSIARSYFWWPKIDEDIERVAGSCVICVGGSKKSDKVPLTPWPWPDRAWSRIHSDFLGPLKGRMFMIVIDAHLKWPEMVDMGKCTTADRVIIEFKRLFSRHGLPRHIVTDNGRQYTSNEFQTFLKNNGIKQSYSPPSQQTQTTNGAAENFVKTFKDKVNKCLKSGKSLEYAVNLFLYDYRSTPHATTGRSPAWMLYKRKLRTRFDLLKPSTIDEVENNREAQVQRKKGNRQVSFALL
ncbi:PREDICTED: uncharacterized protein K02A2.6-like [Vollenhovia emeryi]|uniref:uncharacterized protein K02A2.6-like n=1 Tax=Vollenhovia emeryi TaxID=411798 RepID=UPI0005F52234|nr:PREDICTED: uncharacterized protein K02A2.6-like [Vollenhovia emeryi]